MNRNFVLDGESTDASVRALFLEVSMQLANETFYQEHGFTDYFPEIPADKMSSVSGFGRGTLTVAGQPYGSNNREKGFAKTLTLRKYTSLIDFTEEDIHWLSKAPSAKRLMEFRSSVEGAVNALNSNINLDTAKVYYLGHGSTFLTGGDGKNLFDTDHDIRKSGVTAHPNVFFDSTNFGDSTTHLAFSADALVEALQRMDRFVLNEGLQMRKTRNLRILCSTELAETVERVLVSMYGPDTSHLGQNKGSSSFQAGIGRRITWSIIPDQPFSFAKFWAVIDMDRAKKMNFIGWGWKPRINSDKTIQNGISYNAASVLFGPIFRDWRFAFGTKGDGTTVS